MGGRGHINPVEQGCQPKFLQKSFSVLYFANRSPQFSQPPQIFKNGQAAFKSLTVLHAIFSRMLLSKARHKAGDPDR
jgi:hypothetical protein